jgi:hypothetical protein
MQTPGLFLNYVMQMQTYLKLYEYQFRSHCREATICFRVIQTHSNIRANIGVSISLLK